MATITAPEIRGQAVGEVRVHSVDFRGRLDSGELLTGTPIVEEISTTDLTLTDITVNVIALTINGQAVGIGLAVQFKNSGVLKDVIYRIRITVGTDSSPAQTLKCIVRIEGIPDD